MQGLDRGQKEKTKASRGLGAGGGVSWYPKINPQNDLTNVLVSIKKGLWGKRLYPDC